MSMKDYVTPSVSPCIAHIDLGCIQRNYRRLCASVGPSMQGVGVIKSDAYGHGIYAVANALHEEGVGIYAVGTVDEGHALRKAGFSQEIIILLGAINDEEMRIAQEQNLLVLIYNTEGLQRAAAMATPSMPIRMGIKCETGMGRLGFTPDAIGPVLEFLRAHPHIQPQLVVSHLACADAPEKESMVREQAALFADMSASVQAAFPSVRRSLCNSAGSLAYPTLSGDVARFGVALYGGNPFVGSAWAAKGEELEEAMRISTPILHISTCKAGHSVGYGATYVAPKDMRVAVLGIGYADGLTRSLSSRGTVSIHGKAAPICGRVCMGMCMVDVSHIPEINLGDDAWLVAGKGAFSMQALAEAWGTIIYEVQCQLGQNTRRYETW